MVVLAGEMTGIAVHVIPRSHCDGGLTSYLHGFADAAMLLCFACEKPLRFCHFLTNLSNLQSLQMSSTYLSPSLDFYKQARSNNNGNILADLGSVGV